MSSTATELEEEANYSFDYVYHMVYATTTINFDSKRKRLIRKQKKKKCSLVYYFRSSDSKRQVALKERSGSTKIPSRRPQHLKAQAGISVNLSKTYHKNKEARAM